MQPTLDISLADKFFHITPHGSEHPVLSMPAVSLLEPETMRSLLVAGRDMLKGLGLDISLSFFGLGVFGLPAVVHTYMWQYDQVLDLSIENITVQVETHNDHAHLVLCIDEVRWKPLPAEGRREAIAAELEQLFRHTVTPLIEAAAACAGLKPDLVWNQFGARMISVSDYVLQHAPNEALKDKYRADLELLRTGLPAEVFHRRKNPYEHKPRFVESPTDAGKQLLIRSSCCMWYRREQGVKCYTCPILNDAQREEMKCQMREKQGHSA
ncbi:(2Fe-2S)-binding protein [Paenibacillus hodogayensis]|uniref:(2Fe-2S)-binding protein n=1 Tax=Paenibacillus hodogayensis TaxID=279208 RepID=A0ABV5VTJ5_9BACL